MVGRRPVAASGRYQSRLFDTGCHGIRLCIGQPHIGGFAATCGDLVISADWEGACWDFLFSEEVRPEKSHGGFVCAICERESKHRIFPTLEALWLDHLFRPLEDWINTKLAVAQAVALYRTDHGGSTWARLVSASEPLDFPTYAVPLA